MPTRIDELNKVIQQERMQAKDLMGKAKIEQKNGSATKADEFQLMARLCLEQANRAELEIKLLEEKAND